MERLLTNAQPALGIIMWTLLGFVGLVGLVALVSPRAFEKLSRCGNYWVDTERILSKLNKQVDIDWLVLPRSRWFGAVVVAGVGVIAFLWLR